MHYIKKYANRKLYNTTDKKYLTMDRLAELIKSGEEVSIIDNQTGEDLTSSIISQLLARDKKVNSREIPVSLLTQLLRKGGGTLVGYGKKYASLWQTAMTMSKEETEKFVNKLIKEKELSESEGINLKKEIQGYTSNLKKWIGDHIDQQVQEVLNMMNLATKEQIIEISSRVEALTFKVDQLEKKLDELQSLSHAETNSHG